MCSVDTDFLNYFGLLHLCPPNTPGKEELKHVAVYRDRKYHKHCTPGSQMATDESAVGFKG
jgi:hypothetical protein